MQPGSFNLTIRHNTSKLWFKALIFLCLGFVLTHENVFVVTVVHGGSFAEAVEFVTDSLVNNFSYIICISRNTCGFMWCLRGNKFIVYQGLILRLRKQNCKNILKFVCVIPVALPCVLSEFLVDILIFVLQWGVNLILFLLVKMKKEPALDLCCWPCCSCMLKALMASSCEPKNRPEEHW